MIKQKTESELIGLANHNLKTDEPSQLSDAFVNGMRYAKLQSNKPIAQVAQQAFGRGNVFWYRECPPDGTDLYVTQPDQDDRIKELEIECATLDSCAKFNAEKILELSTKLDELTKFHSSADKLAEKQAECVDKMGRLTSKCKLMMDALNEVNLYINKRHTLQHHINIHDILRDVLEIKLDDE